MSKKVAVFPGSFDPFTIGHAQIVEKALELFDEVIIFMADNPNKKRMFDKRATFNDIQYRYIDLMKEGRVSVSIEEGTVADVAKLHNAKHIVKGIRNATDADYEIAQSYANKWIGDLQTILIPTDKEYSHVSSTLVRSLLNSQGFNKEENMKKANELIY